MMTRAITYTGIAATSIIVLAAFITAKSYSQLGLAAVLYPALVYFVYKLFLDKRYPIHNAEPDTIGKHESTVNTKIAGQVASTQKSAPIISDTVVDSGKVSVVDIEKRAFLKLIGATGLSLFVFSLINRKTGNIFSGSTGQGTTTILDSSGNKITPAEKQVTDGYKISEIDDLNIISYYGFVNKDGGWLIMKEDSDTGSFRYTKGDLEFPKNWELRERLNYDYFHNTF